MMKLIPLGSESVCLRVKLFNSTTGQGLTGLDFESAGLVISTQANNEASPVVYTVAGGDIEDISSIGTYSAPTADHCRFAEVDATNRPGVYEIQLADARYAVTDANELQIDIHGASDLLDADIDIVLDTATLDQISAKLDADGFVKQTYLDTRTLPTEEYATDLGITAVTEAVTELNNFDPSNDTVILDASQPNYTPATASALATVDDIVDAILVDTDTTIPGLIAALDNLIDAIKAKTDDLTFGVTDTLNVNITHVNETEITGDGEEGTEFGPA